VDAVGESEQTRRVEVRTAHLIEQGLLQITVDDNGPGIPPEQMEHLFSPFVSSKKGRGTGLGLAVSQKILNEHGGRVLVDSTPGKGSRFTLEIPATLPTTASQTTAH
jgi:signal transduction histidine kinase